MPCKRKRDRKAYNKMYGLKHKKRLLFKAKRYRELHRDKLVRYLRLWKKRNPDYDRNWRARNRDKKCKNQRTYRQAHPERIRVSNAVYASRRTRAGGKFTEEQWLVLCRKYKHKCLCCRKRKKLTPDHIVPVSKGGTSNIENIQPLCVPCNSSKNDKTIDYRKRAHDAGNSRKFEGQSRHQVRNRARMELGI